MDFKIQNIINCGYCKKQFKSPVFLPCFNTICLEHIQNFEKNSNDKSFCCPFCLETHITPEEGFKADTRVENLINISFHKLDLNSIEARKKTDEALRNYGSKLNELKAIYEDPGYFVKLHFDKLRNECDLKREELKGQIDLIYNAKLVEIDLLEKKCLDSFEVSDFNQNKLAYYEIKLKNWSDSIDNLVIDEKKWKSINEKAKFYLIEASKFINELKSEILQNKNTTFISSNHAINSDLFGELKSTKIPKQNINTQSFLEEKDEEFYQEFLIHLNNKFNKKSEKKCNKIIENIEICEIFSSTNGPVPSKRSGHMAVCDNEFLWLWGGYNPIQDTRKKPIFINHECYSELWCFNFTKKQWNLIPTTGDVPSNNIASPSLILVDYYLVLFGGTKHPFGKSLSNSLYICNLINFNWKKFEISGDSIQPSFGNSIILDQNNLYILFGTDGLKYFCQVFKIDLKNLNSVCLFQSNDHLCLKDFPENFLNGRFRQGVIYYDDKLYVFAGGCLDYEFSLVEIPVFDLKLKIWRFEKTQPDSNTNGFPENRKFHSTLKIDSKVFIIGGCYTYEMQSKLVENVIWELDLKNMIWIKHNKPLPIPTYFHAYCSNDLNEIYIHGGCTLTDNVHRIDNFFKIEMK